jgi:ABC-type polysaccharide/polyol phosphate transport system ATPase subunit
MPMNTSTASDRPGSHPQDKKEGSLTILLEDITVAFQRIVNRPGSMKEYVIRRIKGEIKAKDLKALNRVSLAVRRGEVFGVIGRNGAGKTTMLRVMSRILRPTQGRLRIWGETTPLMGVGAGFNPELTGRENAFIYSSILGRRQVRTYELMDEIIDFSELGGFIDAPLRTYSSGMVARLGFAVAMAERPEILLLDEVLAVGDEPFREKCSKRFRSFCEAGTTVVMVSHSMGSILDLCNRAVWLHRGRVRAIGDPQETVQAFRNFKQKGRLG